MTTKLLGFLLSYEEDWPRTLEALVRRMGALSHAGETVEIATERVRIHPFNLADPVRHDLIIDRLAWWHQHPREWLKKAMMTSRLYLLNNPFTFQAMEKHTAYAAMIRLGLNIPETYLIPPKIGPDNPRYPTTSRKYHDFFDLPAIANKMGYPLFMKPFDGGGWRGVSRVTNDFELMQSYDASGQTMMHLQKGLADYEVFVRSLGIGPQVISLKYDPDQPMHGRYAVSHGFLSPEKGLEARRITKIINAFFRWDFNSCEAILKDGTLWPMDFANATPDIAVTSLHYYFPWTMKAIYAWSAFCLATNRRAQIGVAPEAYFEIADSERSYEEKLTAYEALADQHFETERFEEFRAGPLKELDAVMWELVGSSEFASILGDTVRDTFPPHEQEKFLGHFSGLLSHWLEAEQAGGA
jgi:hypothetical protein